ncbi:hypothetical protein [Streptomyces sp. PanSC9]|uniref:hypothetical protein n=1 Tax=Streptomyces sp. PanSC9 TaxID=1520461 RepID=UPI0011CD6C6C|nr:hypothetical protein [Streptomyces sp. PanSC9]
MHTVTALRATATTGAADSADPLPDPKRLHAKSAYLAARDAQLRLQHDALGRLAAPVPLPGGLPEELHEVAVHGMQRRLAEAFGSPERARQVIDGRITYHHQQQSAAGVQQESATESAAEADLLTAARATLDAQPVRRRTRSSTSSSSPAASTGSCRPPPPPTSRRRRPSGSAASWHSHRHPVPSRAPAGCGSSCRERSLHAIGT